MTVVEVDMPLFPPRSKAEVVAALERTQAQLAGQPLLPRPRLSFDDAAAQRLRKGGGIMPQQDGKVPVGVTTQAGYGGSLAGVLLAVYAFAQGDHTAGTLATIAAGVAFALTQLGRYAQAVMQQRRAVPVRVQVDGKELAAHLARAELDRRAAAGEGPSAPSGMAGGGSFRVTGSAGVAAPAATSGATAVVPESPADVVSDEEEFENVPRPEGAVTPEPPAGEPPLERLEVPPLEPGDVDEPTG